MSAISTATTTVPSAARAHANPPGPALPDFASPPRRARNPFPVGARFPRRLAAEVHAYRPQSATAAPAAAAVFPVGARFPRRTQLDILAYLAGVDLGRRAPVRRAFPVGARFPRRAR